MKAITVAEAGLGVDAMTLTDIDYPHVAENDVVVRVHAAGFTPGELTWPGTWVDRAAWQGLFKHGHLEPGQSVLIHGAGGGVGSIAVQLAREVGAWVIGTGRAQDRDSALELGADVFVDLQADGLGGMDNVDVVFDVIGGDIFERSLGILRAGGRIVTIAAPAPRQPENGQAIFFVVEPDRARLADLGRRLQDGRLKPIVGAVRPLAESAAAFAPDRRVQGKIIISVIDGDGMDVHHTS